MTAKDRPRKKDWKREYYKSKELGRYRDDIRSGSFVIYYFLSIIGWIIGLLKVSKPVIIE